MARSATVSRLKPFLGNIAALSVVASTDEGREGPSRGSGGLRLVDEKRETDSVERKLRTNSARTLARVTEMISRQDWARAQRLLEETVRQDPADELRSYLTEVRAVRHILRQISRWPRPPKQHLELGRLYFGLELGDAAFAEFQRAIQLEPDSAEAHLYLALEYLFRGDEDSCRDCLTRAAEYHPNMPTYDSLNNLLDQLGGQ